MATPPPSGPPKTESAHRTVEIPRSIASRIAEHMEQFDVPDEPGALVFTSLRNGPLLNTYFAGGGDADGEAVAVCCVVELESVNDHTVVRFEILPGHIEDCAVLVKRRQVTV